MLLEELLNKFIYAETVDKAIEVKKEIETVILSYRVPLSNSFEKWNELAEYFVNSIISSVKVQGIEVDLENALNRVIYELPIE
ncbi:hypothetical protein FQU23_015835 [Flavobacterium sp. XN-5]|uniref:hypothetical protein n=1 Tax=Flavobacterium sp. XN-5 TaxID=2599390 RepID=UPI0011C75D30|nr:hypothetical protein [Flavobacterium sp. XN-5]NGY38970.1 hypothetical protein [Flavobacterium sp. XN-5]